MPNENQELRKAGLKVTLPRIKILQLLENAENNNQHLSAEDVYKMLLEAGEDVGLATVYRVLTRPSRSTGPVKVLGGSLN